MAKERQARRNQFLDLIDGFEVEGIAVQVSLSGIADAVAWERATPGDSPSGEHSRVHFPPLLG